MKFWASVVFEFQAGSIAEAGERVNAILEKARESTRMEARSVELRTPPGDAPVSLPPPWPVAAPPRSPVSDGG